MALLGLRCFSQVSLVAAGGGCPGAVARGALPVGTPHCGSLSCSRARGLSYSMAHGIIQDQGLNWFPLHCKADSTAGPPVNPLQRRALVRRSPEVNYPTPFLSPRNKNTEHLW